MADNRRGWFDEGATAQQQSLERTGLLQAIAEATAKQAPKDPLTRLWKDVEKSGRDDRSGG